MPTYDLLKKVEEEYDVITPDFRENDGYAAKIDSSIFIDEATASLKIQPSAFTIATSMYIDSATPTTTILGPFDDTWTNVTNYLASSGDGYSSFNASGSTGDFNVGSPSGYDPSSNTAEPAPYTVIKNWIPFTNITIAKGSGTKTILSAILTLTSSGHRLPGRTVIVKVAFEDVDNAVTPTNFNNIWGRPQTKSYIRREFADLPKETVVQIDLTNSLNEVIHDRTGWASGNDIAVVIMDLGSDENKVRGFYGSDTSGKEPSLYIVWTTT